MINIGDVFLMPFTVQDIHAGDALPYYLGCDSMRIHASAEMLERFQQAADGEKDSGKTYEEGQTDAWKTARRLIADKKEGGLEGREIAQIFGKNYCTGYGQIFTDFTANEAAAKIAEWEDEQEIHAGDVVKMTTGEFKGVVSKVRAEGCYVIFGDGSSREFKKSVLTKTGRTIDIAGLLARIGGNGNA